MTVKTVPSVTTYICDGCLKEQDKPFECDITFVWQQEWSKENYKKDYCIPCYQRIREAVKYLFRE